MSCIACCPGHGIFPKQLLSPPSQASLGRPVTQAEMLLLLQFTNRICNHVEVLKHKKTCSRAFELCSEFSTQGLSCFSATLLAEGLQFHLGKMTNCWRVVTAAKRSEPFFATFVLYFRGFQVIALDKDTTDRLRYVQRTMQSISFSLCLRFLRSHKQLLLLEAALKSTTLLLSPLISRIYETRIRIIKGKFGFTQI